MLMYRCRANVQQDVQQINLKRQMNCAHYKPSIDMPNSLKPSVSKRDFQSRLLL